MAPVVNKLDEIKKVLEDIRNTERKQQNRNRRPGGDGGGAGSDGGADADRRKRKTKTKRGGGKVAPKGGKASPKGSAIGGAARLAGRGAVGAAGAVVAVGAAAVAATYALVKFSEGLVDANRKLGMYSITIERANLMAQIRQMERDRQSAMNTGPQLAELSDALQDLYDEIRPIKDLMTNAGAKVSTLAIRTLEHLVQTAKASGLFEDMEWLLEQILGEFQKDDGVAGTDVEFFNKIVQRKLDEIRAPKVGIDF